MIVWWQHFEGMRSHILVVFSVSLRSQYFQRVINFPILTRCFWWYILLHYLHVFSEYPDQHYYIKEILLPNNFSNKAEMAVLPHTTKYITQPNYFFLPTKNPMKAPTINDSSLKPFSFSAGVPDDVINQMLIANVMLTPYRLNIKNTKSFLCLWFASSGVSRELIFKS